MDFHDYTDSKSAQFFVDIAGPLFAVLVGGRLSLFGVSVLNPLPLSVVCASKPAHLFYFGCLMHLLLHQTRSASHCVSYVLQVL